MKRRLKKFKSHRAPTGEYRKPFYKKWRGWKEKKSILGFPFEYEIHEISQAINDIRRRDEEVKHIQVDEVFDVFISGNDIITL